MPNNAHTESVLSDLKTAKRIQGRFKLENPGQGISPEASFYLERAVHSMTPAERERSFPDGVDGETLRAYFDDNSTPTE